MDIKIGSVRVFFSNEFDSNWCLTSDVVSKNRLLRQRFRL